MLSALVAAGVVVVATEDVERPEAVAVFSAISSPITVRGSNELHEFE